MTVNGLESIELIISKCEALLVSLEGTGKSQNKDKKIERKFSVREVEKLLRVPAAGFDKLIGSGRKLNYSLEEINTIRANLGCVNHRRPADPCLKLAIQSFKGGVAKSVTTIHFAQYLAIRGYRVLLVDCDPQASATSSFGFMPDSCFSADNTLLPYIQGKRENLDYCIVKTYFPGIDLIPSCLPFYDAEFQLAFAAAEADSAEERYGYFLEFMYALNTVEKDYDIVLIDSPPALGMITINILTAVDAIVVPTPPALYDFASTVQYFKMVRKVMGQVATQKKYNFIKILATRVDLRKTMHVEFLGLMREVFGDSMFQNVFLQTSEIENCAAQFKTVYDVRSPQKRAINILDTVFGEMEREVKKFWPSVECVALTEG